MSWNDADKDDATIYKVVLNHEEQFSIWPEYKENPPGWLDAGKVGPKAECLAYIKEVWTDMRPLSLRRRMERMAENPPPPSSEPRGPREKNLVDFLSEGDHRVEVLSRPDRTAKLFKAAIDRNYAHIRFTDTKGGTDLGFSLDRDACDFSKADFESGTGTVHIEGGLTLDYVKVTCVADVDLSTLEGNGRLVKAGGNVITGGNVIN